MQVQETTESKRKPGRPKGTTKQILTSESIINQVERMAALGLTNEQIGYLINVSVATVQNYRRNDPEFLEAMKRGRALGIKKSSELLFNLMNKDDAVALGALKWYEMTRHGLSEKTKTEVEHSMKESFENYLQSQSQGEKDVGSNESEETKELLVSDSSVSDNVGSSVDKESE